MKSWRVPRPRSDARLVGDNGVITFEHQKWLDKLASRTDYAIRPFLAADKILPSDRMILANATAGPFTIALPPAAESQGREIIIKKVDFTGNVVTIDPSGAEVIDWAGTATLSATNEKKAIVCDGTRWWIV